MHVVNSIWFLSVKPDTNQECQNVLVMILRHKVVVYRRTYYSNVAVGFVFLLLLFGYVCFMQL